jgi:hypothetical protein
MERRGNIAAMAFRITRICGALSLVLILAGCGGAASDSAARGHVTSAGISAPNRHVPPRRLRAPSIRVYSATTPAERLRAKGFFTPPSQSINRN